MRLILASALAALLLVPLSTAITSDLFEARATAVDADCRVSIAVTPDHRFDGSSPLEMVVTVEPTGVGPNGVDFSHCGPFGGNVYCSPVVGTLEDGYSCSWYDGVRSASIGGTRDATPLAPNVYASTLTYLGHEMDAVLSVRE